MSRPNGSKILWTVCDSFGKDPEDGSGKCALDAARTPNFDSLCAASETGLFQSGTRPKNPSVDFDSIARLSLFEINGSGSQPALEQLLGGTHKEAGDGLRGAEDTLESCWDLADFFVLRLDRRDVAGGLDDDLKQEEWIEMLDAWLPGLLGRFRPDVFAMSGGIWSSGAADGARREPSPVLLHSGKSRAMQTEGFTLDCCRKGRLGQRLNLRHWLLLLLAHTERLDEVVVGPGADEGEPEPSQAVKEN